MQPWYFDPILVEIGPLAIRWYGLMYALAFAIGYLYFHYSNAGKSLKLSTDKKDLFLFYVIAGILIGGRLGYVIFYNFAYYLENPLKILAVWQGGMSFHGGLIGAALMIYIFSKKYKIHFWVLGDAVTSIAPVGIFFGRIGNFINSELYGRVAEKFCLYFPSDPSHCRYPTQLLEALLEGLILFIILYFIRRYAQKPGVISASFLIFYGIFRIFVEFFREPDPQLGYLLNFITAGQILSLLMILAGSTLIFKVRRK